MKFTKLFAAMMTVVLSISLLASDGFARGGRGGGGSRGGGFSSSRSSSSRSSSSRSSSSRSGGGFGSRKTGTTTRSGSTKRSSAATKKSAVDRRNYEKAKSSGKAFGTKKAAVSDLKAKAKSDPKTKAALNKQYPTKYDKEPATRPSHIPQTHQGNTVIYQNGGYGYMGGGGTFQLLTTMMLLDTMSDVHMNTALRTQGYHVGAAPPVVVATGPSWGTIILFILIGFVVVGLIAFIISEG
jgi:hypothetical protein